MVGTGGSISAGQRLASVFFSAGVVVFLAFLTSSEAAPTSDWTLADEVPRLVPMTAIPDIDEIEVQTRCRDFVYAVRVRRSIETSNPLTGRNPTRGEQLDWADRVDPDASFPKARPISETDYIALYSDAFGPVLYEQKFLRLRVYLADLAYCEPLFKHYGTTSD